jgi:hypothetical protein
MLGIRLDLQFTEGGPTRAVGDGTVPTDRVFVKREKHTWKQSHVVSFINWARGGNLPVPPSVIVFICQTENLDTNGQDAKAVQLWGILASQ